MADNLIMQVCPRVEELGMYQRKGMLRIIPGGTQTTGESTEEAGFTHDSRHDNSMEPALAKPFQVQPTVVPQEGGHGCLTKTARLTCLSGSDMAVPLGRNHVPPELLLRLGAESGWVPQPDCLETPSTAILGGMVESHIKKLSAGVYLD
eukprot:1150976-Pelagomonas_calceolata.AAC.1